MQRIYRFEILEVRYRGAESAVLRARDSAYGSTVTLCEWTPQDSAPAADAGKLADAVDHVDGTEVFSAGSAFYLAAADDSRATAALETLRNQGWFPGEWPGLIAAAATPPVAPAPKPAPPAAKRPSRLGVAVIAGFSFAAGVGGTAILWYRQQQQIQGALDSERQANSRLEDQVKQQQLDLDGFKRAQQDRARLDRETNELAGVWVDHMDWEGRFSDGNHRRFHATGSAQLTITPSAGGFRGEWTERLVFKRLDDGSGFTREYTATFALQRNGDQVTGVADSARRADDPGEKVNFQAVHLDAQLGSPGNLKVTIAWERDAAGTETDGTHETLTKQ